MKEQTEQNENRKQCGQPGNEEFEQEAIMKHSTCKPESKACSKIADDHNDRLNESNLDLDQNTMYLLWSEQQYKSLGYGWC